MLNDFQVAMFEHKAVLGSQNPPPHVHDELDLMGDIFHVSFTHLLPCFHSLRNPPDHPFARGLLGEIPANHHGCRKAIEDRSRQGVIRDRCRAICQFREGQSSIPVHWQCSTGWAVG